MAVTLAQIAELAGVSRGTVDRALNNRGRVDAKVAARIKRIAEEQGYQPNRAGKLLSLAKNPIKIGVLVQSVETPFMRAVADEAERTRDRLANEGAQLIVRTMQSINVERQLELIDELIGEGVAGLAVTPAEDERICARIRTLSAHMPVVTFNADMQESGRLCYVGQDSYASGRACGGLMGMLLGGKGKVLMVNGHPSNLSHCRRVDGFRAEVLAEFPEIQLLPIENCYDDRERAHEIVRRVAEQTPDLGGVYFSAGGPPGGCDAIRELGLRGKVRLICHDLSEQNAADVRAGLIDFLIDQDAQLQGARPAEILLDYLLVGKKPEKDKQLIRIDIRSKYNI